MKYETRDGWVYDEKNNRVQVRSWRDEEACKAQLATLTRCYDCYDCSGCSGCSRCSDCSRCYDCYDCYGCSGCSDCSRCSRCSGCSGCYGCSDCSDCSRCVDKKDVRVGGTVPEVPAIPDIHKAVYAAACQPDALDMSDWHTCGTTHCRGGWVVHLAGEKGAALEKATSTLFAAMQIYKASGCPISPVRFFDSNEDALADMKRLAEGEVQS